MSTTEQQFWNSFNYDPETNLWSLAPMVGPMEVLGVCRKKLEADREMVDAVLSGPLDDGHLSNEGVWVPKEV